MVFYRQENTQASGEVLPVGTYYTQLVKIEEVIKAWGRGAFFTYEILHPFEFRGRVVSEMICLEHENVQTRKIAAWIMDQISKAVGLGPEIEDANQLLHKPFVIEIDHKPHFKNAGELQEKIKYRKALTAAEKVFVNELDHHFKNYNKNTPSPAWSPVDDTDIPF